MFQWYLEAEVCLAYLHDVPAAEDDMVKFSASTWFTRGWTLQELLAPCLVVFLADDWRVIGHKGGEHGKTGHRLHTGPSLTPRISAITKIPESVLNDYTQSQQFSIKARQEWAGGRETTVPEDMVYCLLGLLNVSMPVLYGEGRERAKRRLVREVAEIENILIGDELRGDNVAGTSHSSSAEQTTAVRPKYLPFQRNGNFVGRASELETLERKLLIEKHCQKIAVVGLGGIGKTQVALSFAYHVLDRHPEVSVFWVSALSMETFEQTLGEIAHSCKIYSAAEKKEDVKWLVKRHLSSVAAGRWLIIVDNIDDVDLLRSSGQNQDLLDYLPESTSGLTVFTTRNREVAQSLVGRDIVAVEQMTQSEAFNLLRMSLVEEEAPSEDEATADLLTELDCLPLAITQAAAYININHVSISEYVSLLHGTEQDLVHIMSIEIRDRTRYQQTGNAVATTWMVSFKQIIEQDPVAADLLMYISCIEWKAIPRSILPLGNSQARMTTAIGRLCSYSFLTKRRKEEMYDMHRLVHLATQIWIDQSGRLNEIRKTAMQALLKVFPSGDYTNHQIWREQLPHVARICKDGQCDDVQEKGRLCLLVGQCLLEDRRNQKAIAWLRKSCDLRAVLAEDDLDRLVSQHELGRAYLHNAQYKKAVEVLEHVVRIEKKVFTEDHLNLLTLQQALAAAYRQNGRVKEAIELLERVVQIRQEGQAEHDLFLLESQHQLAATYIMNGHVKEAVELLENIFEIEQKVLPEDGPDRVSLLLARGRTYLEIGRAKEAVEILERVVRIRENELEEDDPARLVALFELARACLANGETNKGIRLLESVLHIQDETDEMLAENRPLRLAALYELARACLANGEINRAIRLLESALRIQDETDETLAENLPLRLAALHGLARACLANGEFSKAIGLLESAVRIEDEILAEYHPNKLITQHGLALAYMANGETDKAVRHFENVVRTRDVVLAENHPDRLASRQSLANVYRLIGELDNAIPLLESVVSVQDETLPENHPKRLESRELLAQAYAEKRGTQ